MNKIILKDAIETYGVPSQLDKAKEELAELIVAICKDDEDNVLEEIGDVLIMLEQLKIIYNIDEYILKKSQEQKLARLSDNIRKCKDS